MSGTKYNYIVKTFRYNGKQYKVYGKTEEEAITKKVETLGELKRGEKTSGENTPLDQWFAEWLALYKASSGITEKSQKQYEELYVRFLQPTLGRKKLKDIKSIELQRILNNNAGKSYSYLKKIESLMKQLFSRARKARMIVYDPAEDLVLPSYTKGERRSLTEYEKEVFLKVEPTVRGAVIFYAMLCTGMRPGELIALQWQDVNFGSGQINVCRALESGSYKTIKGPKTAAGRRVIPMQDELRRRLLELRGNAADGPVFVNQAGHMHTLTTFQRLWNAVKRAMDIEMGATVYRNQIVQSVVAPDLVPYCFRHTFCTDLQRAGVPVNVAKELMGHSDISVTANIYTHRDNELLHDSIAKLQAINQRAREQC